MISIYVIQCNTNLLVPSNWQSNKTANIMLKTYQFKTHYKGDSHSSKTANIILPGLMIKQRWPSLCLQPKYSRLRLFNLGEMSCFNQVPNIMHFNEFEYHFVYSRKDVHLCFIMSPGKMIFEVLELWLSPLRWLSNW